MRTSKMTKAMLRTYADRYLMKLYDILRLELDEHNTYENRHCLEIVREEILRRMSGEESRG